MTLAWIVVAALVLWPQGPCRLRVGSDGAEQNGYNSSDGIVALAEALTAAP